MQHWSKGQTDQLMWSDKVGGEKEEKGEMLNHLEWRLVWCAQTCAAFSFV